MFFRLDIIVGGTLVRGAPRNLRRLRPILILEIRWHQESVENDKVKQFALYFDRLKNKLRNMKTTISSKGQITVPRAVRRALGLSPGTRLEVKLSSPGGFLVTKSATEDFFGRFKGAARRRARWHSGDEAVAALRDAAP